MRIISGFNDYANTYIITKFNECFLVDPSSNYEKIVEELKGFNLKGILLTHAHSDHLDLIGEFKVPIYIHENDLELLFLDNYNGYTFFGQKRPYKRENLNLIMVKDKIKIPLGNKFIEVIFTPGHTKGSVCYLYEDKLFSGDTIFLDGVGRWDLYSGNLFSLKKSLVKLINTLDNNIKIYPGHGEQTTVKKQKNNPYYLKWAKQMR